MTSIFANLFLLLQAQLQTIVDGSGNPAFPFIDHDLGQLEDQVPAIGPGPAILIDFDKFNFQDIGENCQTGEGPVILKVVFKPYSGTSANTPDAYKQKGLNYYELESQVKAALNGWCPDPAGDIYGPLDFDSVTTSKERTDLRIRVMVFTLGIDDYSNKTPSTTAPFTLNITDNREHGDEYGEEYA